MDQAIAEENAREASPSRGAIVLREERDRDADRRAGVKIKNPGRMPVRGRYFAGTLCPHCRQRVSERIVLAAKAASKGAPAHDRCIKNENARRIKAAQKAGLV